MVIQAFEIPIFAYSRWLLDHVGVSGLLIIAQLAYSSRVAVYSIVHDPWLVLLVEPLHGVTYGHLPRAWCDTDVLVWSGCWQTATVEHMRQVICLRCSHW